GRGCRILATGASGRCWPARGWQGSGRPPPGGPAGSNASMPTTPIGWAGGKTRWAPGWPGPCRSEGCPRSVTMTVSSDADPKAEGSPRDEPAARCRRAAIDVGTHSVRLLIVEAGRAGEGLAASSRGKGEAFPPWREVYRRQEITRLGEG